MVTRMPSLRSRSRSAKRGSITTGEQEQRTQMFHCGTTRQPCSECLGGGGRLHRPNRQGMRRAKRKPQFGDPYQVTLSVVADLLHDPPAERGVAPCHAVSDHPAGETMRMRELTGDHRHQAPPGPEAPQGGMPSPAMWLTDRSPTVWSSARTHAAAQACDQQSR